jgi:hypothetical protein
MKSDNTIANFKYKVSSIVMLLALAWLTVSLPFVYADQQAQKEMVQKQYDTPSAEEDSNPLTNTTEEKTGNVNTLSEYLHDTHITEHPYFVIETRYRHHAADLYIAFHPETICPPPNTPAS